MTDSHEQPVVRIINKISAQFSSRPVPAAAEEIAHHIEQFWDPRMRMQLLALDAEAVGQLDERAVAAIATLRAAQV